MKRLMLIAAAFLFAAEASQACGGRVAQRRAARAEAKQGCPCQCPATPVRTAASAAVGRVQAVVEAKPVRTYVGNALVAAGQCVGGFCR